MLRVPARNVKLFFLLLLMVGLIFLSTSPGWAARIKAINVIPDPTKYRDWARMPSLNDKGQIAFIAGIFQDAFPDRTDVLFYDGNTFTNITADMDISPHAANNWPNNPILNNYGQIAFHKGGDIYFYDGISIKNITGKLEIEPYDLYLYSYVLNDSGQIAFPATSSAGYDVYFYDGTSIINITADLDMDAGAPSLNDNGQIAFHVYGAAANHWDIYYYDGVTLTNITASLDISAYSPIINNKGQIAFRGQTGESGHHDIYLYDSTGIINITAQAGIYLDADFYHALWLNNNGQLVFNGTDRFSDKWLTDKTGIYLYEGTALTHISSYSSRLSLNDRGQIAFFSSQGPFPTNVYFYDGKSIVYRGPGGCSEGIIHLNNKAQIVYETPACTFGQSIYFFDGTYSSNIVELPRSANLRISKVVANENSFSAEDPALNDQGQIAFVGQDRGDYYKDVYLYEGDKITNITADLKVHAQAPAINNSGQIAFLASDFNAQKPDIYFYNGQNLENITADLNISVSGPSLNDLGQIAFLGSYSYGSPDQGYKQIHHIYFYDGSEVTNMTANLNISVIYNYSIGLNNKGQIAFWAQDSSSGRKDIYIMDGTKLINITSRLNDVEFSYMPDVDLNDHGQLTFSAHIPASGRYGVYFYDGIAFKYTPALSDLPIGRPNINNQGQVAFISWDQQNPHVYLYDRDILIDITANLEVKSFRLSGLSLNNKGQVAIGYTPYPYGYNKSQQDIAFYDGQKFINITHNETKYCPCSSLDINDKGQTVFSGRDSADRIALYFYDGRDFTNIISDSNISHYSATQLYPSLNNKGQVAFSTPQFYLHGPSPNDIYFYDGNILKHITANMRLSVSPPSLNNNGWIAFSGATWDEHWKQISNIYLYDGNTLKNLTADLRILANPPTWAISPSLNDRGQIGFTVYKKDYTRSDIYLYDGEKFSNITSHLTVSSSNPSLNNNGQIAFEGFDDATGRRDIYLYDGKQITNITAKLAFSTSSPVLNDYGQIAFKKWIREATAVGSPAYIVLPAEEVYFYNGSKIIEVIHQIKVDYLDLSLNNQGQIAFSDKYNIYLAQPNKSPIAEASNNQKVVPGSTVKLDGSGSSDPEDDPLSYSWFLVAKPAGSNAYLADQNKSSPSLLTDLAGIYEVQLVVGDGIDESAPDKVIITAVGPKQGPVAYGGPDQVVSTGSTVILNGANSYSPNDDDLVYNWSIISKPDDSRTPLANAYGEKWALIADADGIYEVQLIVSNDQSVSEPDTVTIIALGKGAKIRVASNKSQYMPGDTLQLYIWTGNATITPEVKADVFMGIGFPNGRLYFFDPALNLKPANPTDPGSFIPFAQGAILTSGFVFPTSAEMNADSDGNGKLDTFRLFSVTLPPNLPLGSYFAFAALAEPGTAQTGAPKLIGQVSIASFIISP